MRIAFIAGPAAGHVYPTLPLVHELTRRGHRVDYATGAEFDEPIIASGATPRPLDWRAGTVQASKGGQTTGELAEMLLASVRSIRRVLPDLHRWIDAERPDVICFDSLTVVGGMVADKLGLPAVATVPTFAGNDRFNVATLLVPPDFDPQHPTMSAYIALRDEVAAEYGVPVETMAGTGGVVGLNVVFIPREFQIRGEDFGDEFRFVGPSFGGRDGAGDWRPPAGARVLFISLGTIVNDRPDFFATCVKAFAGTDWHVAMAVGERVDVAALGDVPANFEVRPYFPQPTVLRYADAFLSHTGMGSTMEALMRRVPIVSYPQIPEQAANGRRVQELGLGRLLDITGDLDPDGLRDTVDEVAADPRIRANLAAMAEHLRAAGGPPAGADAVEELVRSSGRVTSVGS